MRRQMQERSFILLDRAIVHRHMGCFHARRHLHMPMTLRQTACASCGVVCSIIVIVREKSIINNQFPFCVCDVCDCTALIILCVWRYTASTVTWLVGSTKQSADADPIIKVMYWYANGLNELWLGPTRCVRNRFSCFGDDALQVLSTFEEDSLIHSLTHSLTKKCNSQGNRPVVLS